MSGGTGDDTSLPKHIKVLVEDLALHGYRPGSACSPARRGNYIRIASTDFGQTFCEGIFEGFLVRVAEGLDLQIEFAVLTNGFQCGIARKTKKLSVAMAVPSFDCRGQIQYLPTLSVEKFEGIVIQVEMIVDVPELPDVFAGWIVKDESIE